MSEVLTAPTRRDPVTNVRATLLRAADAASAESDDELSPPLPCFEKEEDASPSSAPSEPEPLDSW